MAWRLKHMMYKDRLRDVGLFSLFSLVKTRQRGNLIAIHSSLMAIYMFRRARPFSEAHTKRTWSKGHRSMAKFYEI